MQWQEIRQHYPEQWLLVEALEARSIPGQRIIDQLAVIDTFADSPAAMRRYQQLHQSAPTRELYVVHSSRKELKIRERQWIGIRSS